jgi:F0F1-type ATP synthase membrane subunit c/vacuolar-type H+-ATPase subunit K
VRRALAIATMLALVLPAVAAAAEKEEEFDPAHEWELKEWVPIHIGPLDLSINKAVAYLMLGTVVSIVLGIVLMRVRLRERPDRRQTVGEIVYEVAQVQVAEQGLPTKAIGRWFPYVASLLIFVWVLNMIGFIPLPLSDETVEIFGLELPTLAIYAATSTLSVTLALGIGLGSLGAGIGIGNIFGSMIQAVARQPELRGELQGIQWIGFALTEACVFYGLIGGLLAFVLV